MQRQVIPPRALDPVPVHGDFMVAAVQPQRSLVVIMLAEGLPRLTGRDYREGFERMGKVNDLSHGGSDGNGIRSRKLEFGLHDRRSTPRNRKRADIEYLIERLACAENMFECHRVQFPPSPVLHFV